MNFAAFLSGIRRRGPPGKGRTRTSRAAGYGWAHAWALAVLVGSTGERPSAVLKLKWRDYRDNKLDFRDTKTKNGIRRIPVCRLAAGALERIREESIRLGDDDFVFCYDDGKPLGITLLRGRFYLAMKRLGLPERDAEGLKRIPYSLKHTFITLLVDEMEADEVLVREYVGHSYGHGVTRVLAGSQARYKHRRAHRLDALVPSIDRLFEG